MIPRIVKPRPPAWTRDLRVDQKVLRKKGGSARIKDVTKAGLVTLEFQGGRLYITTLELLGAYYEPT